MRQLEYATGSATSVIARSYRFAVANTATDVGGNRLQQATMAAFTTLRRLTISLQQLPPMSGWVEHGNSGAFSGYSYHPVSCGEDGVGAIRTYFTFNMAVLPAGIVEFEGALLRMFQNPQRDGMLFPSSPIDVADIVFESFTQATFDVAPRATIGTISVTEGEGWRELNASALRDALRDDYGRRELNANLTQFRVATRAAQCRGYGEYENHVEKTNTFGATFLVP